MLCPIHQVEMIEKSGQFGTYYSHTIPDVGFCNGKKITPFKKANDESPTPPPQPLPPQPDFKPNPPSDKEVWDAKDRQSMAQTAIRASAEIVVALINIGDSDVTINRKTFLKEIAEFAYQWLEGKKRGDTATLIDQNKG